MIDWRTTHGLSKTPEYRAWASMWQRCSNPKNIRYPRYGARGITICERWEKFENFLADMGPRPSSDHSIDRKDNDADYEPTNCRWAEDKVREIRTLISHGLSDTSIAER